MKQEFLTERGKVFIENNRLLVKNIKPARFNDSLIPLAILVMFAIDKVIGNTMSEFISYGLTAFLVIVLVIGIIDVIHMNRWKNRFDLRKIKSIAQQSDDAGMETHIVINFRSGTRKRIIFRTAEKQHEPFVDLLTRSAIEVQAS